jgi:hypothetical protein
MIEPGPADRGQPTFFLPRRQGWVFRVRVPSVFGQQTLTWTIRANGKTERAYGELMAVEEITERIIQTRGGLNPGDGDPNRPPVIAIAPLASVSAGRPVAITATVSDDGLPKPRAAIVRTQASDATQILKQTNSVATAARAGLRVTWMQLRGPAKVTLSTSGPTAVAEGKALTTATFPVAGTYVLRATANDSALSTKADVTVTVGAAAVAPNAPVVDNERVTVWKTFGDVLPPHASGDAVWVSLDHLGQAAFRPTADGMTGRGVYISVKDARPAPLPNSSGHPNAFPRPGVKKILENDRVVVWDYTWAPGVATPMHFHDKDVIVTYVADGALTSTTADGLSTVNELKFGDVRFNRRDRLHTELLTNGQARAIVTELK